MPLILDFELLFCGIENQAKCFLFFPLSILLSYLGMFVSHSSSELCYSKSPNLVYTRSDCIMGREAQVHCFFFFYPFFFLSLFCMCLLKMYFSVFSGTLQTWTMSCNNRLKLGSLLLSLSLFIHFLSQTL